MNKCIICKKKGNRFCAALNETICSLCCGTIRQKEIECFDACEYLKKGKDYQMKRHVSKQISEKFQKESDDVFKNEAVLDFVVPLEQSFVEHFYNDKSVDDGDIYNSLVKVYSYQKGNTELLNADNRCEAVIFTVFNRLNEEISDISQDLKSESILRIMKSIKTASGGIFGNRNYLEFIYSMFTKNGRWSSMFKDGELV